MAKKDYKVKSSKVLTKQRKKIKEDPSEKNWDETPLPSKNWKNKKK